MMAASDQPADAPPHASFRRVLVALDSALDSDSVLEMAAGIAAANACELYGLFVEDQDLLRLAGLPFAREIQLARAMSRALAPEQLLQDLRARAGLAQTAILKQAALHDLTWSFQVAQGRSEEVVLLAAAAGDIIAMGRRFGPLAQPGRVSRRARLLAARAPGPLLLAGELPAGRPGPVVLPYDGSPAAEAMLGVAIRVARARGQPLEILLLGNVVADAGAFETRLRAATGGRQPPALRVLVPRNDAAALRRLLEADGGLLVLPADSAWFTPARVEQIIERARVPVILQTDVAPDSA